MLARPEATFEPARRFVREALVSAATPSAETTSA
jgi:hypothetical protein